MSTSLRNPIHDDYRGGSERFVTYSEFVGLAGEKTSPIVVTSVQLPDLSQEIGEDLK